MKPLLRYTLGTISALFFGLCQAQPASECLSISEEGNSNVWKNICDTPISVAYCSTGKPIWGKRCGDGANFNVFYTHLSTMKPGEKKSINKDFKTAACRGELNAWDLKDSFSSDSQGRFDCYNPREIEQADLVPMLSRASGTTEDDACRNVHNLAGTLASAAVCICRLAGRVHICQVTSLGARSPIAGSYKYSLTQYIKEKISCSPDDVECLKSSPPSRKTSGGSGKRD